MTERTSRQRRGVRYAASVGLLGLVLAATFAVAPSAADHGGPHVEALTRNSFTDDVAAQFRVKLDSRQTLVSSVKDASDVVLARITLEPGVIAPWHTHSGPALLLNTGPGTLTSVISDDCVARDYPPGAALVDPGQGSLHWAVNNSGEDVILYAVFLGVTGGPVVPADPPEDCLP